MVRAVNFTRLYNRGEINQLVSSVFGDS